MRGVYRHRVDSIYEVHYLGGVLRATGDHSVFVRTRNGIQPKAVKDLRPGDVLVGLPMKVRGVHIPGEGTQHSVRSHKFSEQKGLLELDLWSDDPETLEKYAFALENQGKMTQYEIAEAIGVSQATVGHWQRGIHSPRAISRKLVKTELPDKVPVTPELLKLLGYYTAEGRDNGGLEFVFGAHEADLQADCIALMRKVFGLEPRIERTSNTVRIHYGVAPLGRFFSRLCGNGSHNKHVPEILWDLPRPYFEAYLEGYAKGDGYVTKEGKLSITSVSRQLIRELTWLCAMHGIQVGVRRVELKAGRKIGQKSLPAGEVWNLIIGKTSNPFISDDEVVPNQGKRPYVKEVVVKPYDGYVYDLCGCDNEAFFGGEKPVLLHNSRVRDLFRQAKAHAPCIIFIDEIDAVGRHRGAGLGGGHDEREQTLNQLLVEMDGFESSEGIIILAATNRPDILDPALLRPGRFDRQVVMDLPDVKGREGILKVHTRNIPLSRDVKLDVIAKGTPGLSGADLENLVNEAVLLASRKGRKRVRMEDFEEAKDKVMMGMARKMAISDEEKKLIAYHETGHALMAKLMPGGDPVHKVTIIPRGRALGVTHFLPMDERHTYSKSYCMAKLVYALGGRAAEKLVFGEVSTGAGGDYEQATELARKMVCEWGMSERLGPIVYGQREEEIFLGREITRRKDYSERTAELIDQEIKALIEEAERTAERLLKENEDKLHAVAQALLEYEVLDGEQIDRILRGEPLHKSKPGRTSSSKEPPVPTAASEG
ncbi:MAG TPA: ATP-dependent zinc metalloprotease FtsH [Firmicutes bacterium]|nr:ATP-dependent zinc metalloprotease FtsH [Bacillota bacterium]